MSKNNLKGTQTEKNLMTALQGEALAYMKYTFYKKGLTEYTKDFENLLDEIIHQEKEHAEIWFKQLHDGTMPSNENALLDAIESENFEHLELYPKFSKIAEDEGFHEISELFKNIAIVEGNHSKQFQSFQNDINNTEYYKDGGYWKCRNCGHIVKSTDAPVTCPVCEHPQKYFTRL